MERTPEIFNKIEAYLNDTLPDRERSVFEQQIAQDQQLKEEVARHKILAEVLVDEDTLDFKKQLKEIGTQLKHQKTPKSKKPRVLPLMKSWQMVASIALLIGLGIVSWYQFPSTDDQPIFDQFYQPYSATNSWRGSEDDKKRNTALQLYHIKQYEAAIPLLKTLTKEHPNYKNLHLYLGNCYLSTNKTTLALQEFDELANDTGLYEEALWYKSLAHIKMQEYKNARTALQELIAYNGVFYKDAKALIEKINHQIKE